MHTNSHTGPRLKERRSLVLKKINSKGILTSLAAEEFPDARKSLFGDGFEERLKARSETAKTLFQAANVGKTPRFFEVAPPLSGAEGIEGVVHSEVLHGTVTTEVTPAPEGLGAGATNPISPRTNNIKSGRCSFSSNYCRYQFKSKTIRPSSSAPSRQTKTFSSKLAVNLQRPLGLTSYKRLSNRLHKSPVSDKVSSGHYSHPGGKQFNRERGSGFIDKRSHPPSFSGSKTRGVCQQPISCPQKRGWSETSNKFDELESICEVRTLQNGKHPYAPQLIKKRRLSGQNRFEGCLLHSPHLGKSPKISTVSLEGKSLRICMPSIRTSFGPTSFHQDHETSNRAIAPVRDSSYNLSRRHADYGRDSRNGQMSCSYDSEPSRKPGVHYKLPEISSNTNYNYRISGISCRLKNLDFISSKGEDKESQKSMSVNSRQPTAINTTTFPTFGLPNVHHSGSLPCTNSFSVLTNRQEQSLKYLPRLLGNSPTQSTCTGRVDLVEGQFGSLEWESTSFRGTRPNNRNRCFPQRVGSLLHGSNNRGKMVSPGTRPPYKLSGTVSTS